MKTSLLTGSQNTAVLSSELGRLETGASEIALFLIHAPQPQPAHPEVSSSSTFYDGLRNTYRFQPIDAKTLLLLLSLLLFSGNWS